MLGGKYAFVEIPNPMMPSAYENIKLPLYFVVQPKVIGTFIFDIIYKDEDSSI